MSKYDQDISEKIYQDIKNIVEGYLPFMASEFADKKKLTHELIVNIVDACRKNNYFEVRYY